MVKLWLAIILIAASAVALAGPITTLLLNAPTTGVGTGVNYSSFTPTIPQPNRWFQATLNGASAVSAAVNIEGSTDNTNWVVLSTLNLTSASATQAAALVTTAPWIRGNITAISGTGETVTLRSGE